MTLLPSFEKCLNNGDINFIVLCLPARQRAMQKKSAKQWKLFRSAMQLTSHACRGGMSEANRIRRGANTHVSASARRVGTHLIVQAIFFKCIRKVILAKQSMQISQCKCTCTCKLVKLVESVNAIFSIQMYLYLWINHCKAVFWGPPP